MKQFALFLCCISMMACQKEALQLESDIQSIKKYLSDNGLTATEDPTANYFYNLFWEGDSISPVRNIGIKVMVDYKAFLLDGTIVHDTNGGTETIELDEAIYGWQLALPRMNIRDSMLLYLPSRLAYGDEGYLPTLPDTVAIPPNSVLAFKIHLVDVYPHF